MKNLNTRDLLKLAARRLFARQGFDGVTVRDIVMAAGQRNSGSLHYYFGTKDELARELVLDGAKLIDHRRNKLLDEIECNGGPTELRQVIEVLVWPSTNLAPEGMEGEDTYIRFITILQMSHRELFLDALEGKWASGYERSLNHIRQFLVALDPELVNQRLMFMSLYLRATMSSREASLEGRRQHFFWRPDFTMQNLIDTIEGILLAPVSLKTSKSLKSERKFGMLRPKESKKRNSLSMG